MASGESSVECHTVSPAEDLGEGFAKASDVAEDAVFAALAELDGLGGLADALLVFQQTGTENGHEALMTVHGMLEGSKAVALELEVTGFGVGRFSDPGGGGTDFKDGAVIEAADPRRWAKR